MIAVVTGGSGFIGGHLVAALRALDVEVRLWNRAEIALDDRDAVLRAPIWDGATHCFHLAGLTRARTDAEFRRANVDSVRHIAQALAERKGQGARLIHFSSLAAVGPGRPESRPLTEGDTPAPVEAYGRSKLEAERVLSELSDQVDTTILRPAAVYGPGDRDFLQAFRQASRRIALHAAPMRQRISVVSVHDVVSATLAAAATDRAIGRTYFIADARPVTWHEVYSAAARIAGARPYHVQVPASLLRAAALALDLTPRLGRTPLLTRHKATLALQHSWICDATCARSELAWAPRVTFEAGMKETFDWYVAAGWLARGSASGANRA